MLLFGGIYSNLQALEALIAVAKAEGIPAENCICTGDIIGYCAQPEETIQTFKNWKARSIVGNVELQLRDGEDDCGCDFKAGSRCDGFSQQWYPYAQSQLSQDSLHYFKTIPDHIQFTLGAQKFTVVHGSYFNVSEFIFNSTPWSTKVPNFEVRGQQRRTYGRMHRQRGPATTAGGITWRKLAKCRLRAWSTAARAAAAVWRSVGVASQWSARRQR